MFWWRCFRLCCESEHNKRRFRHSNILQTYSKHTLIPFIYPICVCFLNNLFSLEIRFRLMFLVIIDLHIRLLTNVLYIGISSLCPFSRSLKLLHYFFVVRTNYVFKNNYTWICLKMKNKSRLKLSVHRIKISFMNTSSQVCLVFLLV